MTTTPAQRWAKADQDLHSEAGPAVSLPVACPPVALGRPVRVAVVNNPGSGSNRRRNRFRTIIDILKHAQIAHAEADSLDGLVAVTQKFLTDGVEVIAVNGGDGTVQGVITGLFRDSGSRRPPLLAVLPGGSTNTTARNVGYAARTEAALQELITEAAHGQLRGRVEERPVMRLDGAAGSGPLYAMFFGAGAVYHGIRFAKDQVESRGLHGQLGAGVALAVFLGKIATGEGRTLFPPLHAHVVIDGERQEGERLRGLIVSTMDRQFLGLRPYWGREPGPMHYSSLAYSPKHLVRAALPIMFGWSSRLLRPELGYRSCNVSRLELHLDSGFTLDGELFVPETGMPLRLTAERTVFFLRRNPG